jgi:hypothetical protein
MREGRKTGFARHLRRTMTDAERSIWHHLRNRAFMGCKFRRQHPIGAYVVDFVCLERRLVVELDGGQHAGDAGDEGRDKACTTWVSVSCVSGTMPHWRTSRRCSPRSSKRCTASPQPRKRTSPGQ